MPLSVQPQGIAEFLRRAPRKRAGQLTPESAREIRRRAAAGASRQSLARDFDLSMPTIKAVVERQIYRD